MAERDHGKDRNAAVLRARELRRNMSPTERRLRGRASDLPGRPEVPKAASIRIVHSRFFTVHRPV